jgi:peptidoglycan/LPS O-acetylase OafA/YrhL
VPILLFFIFVAVVCVCIVALGYSLSSFEEQPISRRCRMSYLMSRRRKVRRQRVRCRVEG